MFMEMLLKSHVQSQCEKETSLIIHVIYMPALTNAHIMMLNLKKCSHLDVTSQSYQISV